MYEVFLLLALLLHSSKGSLVLDRETQDAVHISDYCPESPNCVEGSHVMCMYYNPERPISPRCYNPLNVTMDAVLSNKLVKLLNAVRGKLALGKERGQHGELLPKAYGMMKVGWDSELATFAQVLANQCFLMHDLCRATRRFPNPGQVIGSCRFTHPGWAPISKVSLHSADVANLTQDKLLHAMTAIVKSWYTRKEFVTPSAILKYPDWTKTSTLPKIYLEMVFGHITHMGCGVSAATTYSYSTRAEAILNRVIVVCNLSSRPSIDQPVYNVNPPTEEGYTVRCGCPPGYDEDESCLCLESKKEDTRSLKGMKENAGCVMSDCQANVILLPIFAVEDAPPDKLIPPALRSKKTGLYDIYDVDNTVNNSMDYYNRYQPPQKTHEVYSKIIIDENHRIGHKKIRTTIKPILQDVPNRFFDSKPSPQKPSRKLSLFSKVPVFELGKKDSYRRDVEPRKDFTKAKSLANNYLSQKKKYSGYASSSKHSRQPTPKTETYLSSVEEKVINSNYHIKNKAKGNVIEPIVLSEDELNDLESSHEKSDDNLMHLLNKLEQEVKHIELDGVKREIFDAKIRKIYGAVVGDNVELISRKRGNMDVDGGLDTEFTEYETDFDTEHEKYSDYESPNHNSKILHHKSIDAQENNVGDNYYDANIDYRHEGRPSGNGRRSHLVQTDFDEEHVRHVKKPQYNPEFRSYEIDMRNIPKKEMYKDDEEIKPRHLVIEKVDKLRDLYSEIDDRQRIDPVEKRPLEHENFINPLTSDRRKFYQTKLENLEKKLRESHTKHHKSNKDRPSFPMRSSTRLEAPIRPVKTQLDPFYMADRARFLNGF